jgi:hypothetical protein
MCLQLVLQTHATCREPYQPRHMSCKDCNLVFWNMQSQKFQTLLRRNRSYMKNSHAFSFSKTISWTLSITAPSIAITWIHTLNHRWNYQVASVTTTDSNSNPCHEPATSMMRCLYYWMICGRGRGCRGVRRTQPRTVSEDSNVHRWHIMCQNYPEFECV